MCAVVGAQTMREDSFMSMNAGKLPRNFGDYQPTPPWLISDIQRRTVVGHVGENAEMPVQMLSAPRRQKSKATRRGGAPRVARVADVSPARTSHNDHGHSNGPAPAVVAVDLEQAREKGRELRAAVALEGDHPAAVWFQALLDLSTRAVVVTRVNARGDVYAWLVVGDESTLFVGKQYGEEALMRTAIAAVGLHLFSPAAEAWKPPQEVGSRAVSDEEKAWGNAFARAFLDLPNTKESALEMAVQYGKNARRELGLPDGYRPTAADAWRLLAAHADRIEVTRCLRAQKMIQQLNAREVLLWVPRDFADEAAEAREVAEAAGAALLLVDGWLPNTVQHGHGIYGEAFRKAWEGDSNE